jgi:hypothetical protein
MADVNVNLLQPVRFEAGGELRLADAGTGDVYIVRNKNVGTLRMRLVGYDPLKWQENGVNQVPIEGDQQSASEIEFEMKLSKRDALGIFDLAQKRNTSSNQGLSYVFTVTVKIPNYRGASAGQQFVFANAYFMPDSIEVEAGERFDTVRFRMESTTIGVVGATY